MELTASADALRLRSRVSATGNGMRVEGPCPIQPTAVQNAVPVFHMK
jgi:hypothetical protein